MKTGWMLGKGERLDGCVQVTSKRSFNSLLVGFTCNMVTATKLWPHLKPSLVEMFKEKSTLNFRCSDPGVSQVAPLPSHQHPFCRLGEILGDFLVS